MNEFLTDESSSFFEKSIVSLVKRYTYSVLLYNVL